MARVWQLLVRADGDTKSAQKEIRALQRSVKSSGQSMANVGRSLTMGLTVPLGLAAAGAVKLASDAGETASKMKKTFGPAGMASINKQLDAFATATGASRYALREQATTIGALLKPMNLGSAATNKMAVDVTKLAKDLSSFHNIAEDDALDKLRSGLTGEAEPLKQLGILINEATVKEQAYASGIAKRGKELTEQQKVQARWALIVKQSADAHGDAADTANSFSNQAKALKNSVTDLGVSFGNLLLPYATKLVEKLRSLTSWVQHLSPGQQKLAAVLAATAAVLPPIIWGLGSMVTAASALVPIVAGLSLPLLGVVAGLAALGVALVVAYKKSDTFRAFVNRSFVSLRTSAVGVLNSLRATIQQWIVWGSAIWARYGDQILAVVVPAFNAMRTIIGTQLANLRDVIKIILALLRGDWSGAWNLFKGVVARTFTAVVSTARAGAQMLLGVIRALPGMLLGLAGFFYSAGKALGKRVVDAIIDAVKAAGGRIKGAVKDAAGDAYDDALGAIGLGKSLSGKKQATTAKASLALKRAEQQARIDASAGLTYQQALKQYNHGVDNLAAARKIKDDKKRKAAVLAAQKKLDELAQDLVSKRTAMQQAAADKAQADKEAAEAEAERKKAEQEEADQKSKDDQDKADQDARDAENFRRRSLGLMSVEEEVELARANEIRAQYGLPPVKSMSEIGSNPTEAPSSGVTSSSPMAPGDTGAGFNGIPLTSPSALGAAQSALNRLGITINTNSSDPEAIVRRLLFAMGANRLRMGGGI